MCAGVWVIPSTTWKSLDFLLDSLHLLDPAHIEPSLQDKVIISPVQKERDED